MPTLSNVGEIGESVEVPIQGIKLDNTLVQLSLVLEDPKEVAVQLIYGIFNPRKHFVVTFKENFKMHQRSPF